MNLTKDWTGNKKSIYTTLGASNHVEAERAEHDYYATEPKALNLLLELEEFNDRIWEPACGENHLVDVLMERGFYVQYSDIVKRIEGQMVIDFLQHSYRFNGDIITNPPHKYAKEFITKALSLIPYDNKVAMFLKVQFLEGKERKQLFKKYPPKTVYVSSTRLMCAKNGRFEDLKKNGGSAIAYAWFVWQKGYKGDTILKWFN